MENELLAWWCHARQHGVVPYHAASHDVVWYPSGLDFRKTKGSVISCCQGIALQRSMVVPSTIFAP